MTSSSCARSVTVSSWSMGFVMPTCPEYSTVLQYRTPQSAAVSPVQSRAGSDYCAPMASSTSAPSHTATWSRPRARRSSLHCLLLITPTRNLLTHWRLRTERENLAVPRKLRALVIQTMHGAERRERRERCGGDRAACPGQACHGHRP